MGHMCRSSICLRDRATRVQSIVHISPLLTMNTISSVVRASVLDHGGSWVQMPSETRIFPEFDAIHIILENWHPGQNVNLAFVAFIKVFSCIQWLRLRDTLFKKSAHKSGNILSYQFLQYLRTDPLWKKKKEKQEMVDRSIDRSDPIRTQYR